MLVEGNGQRFATPHEKSAGNHSFFACPAMLARLCIQLILCMREGTLLEIALLWIFLNCFML
jgi:hypothetical protein